MVQDHSKDDSMKKNNRKDDVITSQESDRDHPDFIRETIIKKESIKDKLLRYLGMPVVGGLIFGIAAAITFAGVTALFNKNSANTSDQIKESDMMLAESESDMENLESQEEQELQEMIQQAIEEKEEENVHSYDKIQTSVKEVQKSIVTVTAMKQNVDWFEISYSSQYNQSGILIRETSEKFYILTGYDNIKDADSIQVGFADDSTVTAALEGYDSVYHLAVISIERNKLSSAVLQNMQKAAVGNTASLSLGMPVFAIGNVSGSEGSVSAGIISYINKELALNDSVIWGLQSNIQINGEGCSFLISAEGKLLGIYTSSEQSLSNGYSQAYGINQLMPYINRIYNHETTAGIGITGKDIEASVREAQQLPEGIYITNVEKDSAAYRAGVQNGDILCQVAGTSISSMEDYEAVLVNLSTDKEIKIVVYRDSKDVYQKKEFSIIPTVRQN